MAKNCTFGITQYTFAVQVKINEILQARRMIHKIMNVYYVYNQYNFLHVT